MSLGRCLNCRKPLKPYRPPTKDVPRSVADGEPYCSRVCLEEHLGIRDRAHGHKTGMVK